MKKKYIYTLIIGLSANYALLYPQTSKYSNFGVTAESPTAYQFTRYDEMPVSEYTGLPSINIPLYEVSVDGLKVPLNLSYHARGVKVDQEASWVGLGWDMTVGAITQSINEDDDIYPYFYEATTKFRPDYFPSYYYNVEYFPWKNDNYADYNTPKIDTLQQYPIEMRYGYRVATNFYMPEKGKYVSKEAIFNRSYKYVDSDPDVFIANFLGEKLHFIMEFKDKPTKAIVLNKKNYKVDIIYGSNRSVSWVITNPDGIKFFFDEKIETIGIWSGDGRYPAFGSSDQRRVSNTWMLTKIQTKSSRDIVFKYQRTSTVSRKKRITHLGEEKIAPTTYRTLYYPASQLPQVALDQGPKQIMENRSTSIEPYCYVESISFPFGTINFKLSEREDVSESRKLDQMTVLNNNKDTIRNINLKYDYYTENDNKSKRLKLQNITADKIQQYSFKYNNTVLPTSETYAQDYWGYYNGCTSNKSLLPNPSRLKYSFTKHIDTGNNKSANLPYTKAGILETIYYPLGGNVSFNYELNEFEETKQYWIPDYDKSTNILSKGYGLRIKDITYQDSNGDEIKKISYEYKGGKAIVGQKPVRTVNYEWMASSMQTRVFSEQIALLSTSGAFQANPFSSNAGIGYDSVISIQKGKNLNINGKVISVYYNSYDITNNTDDPAGHGYFITYLPSIKNSKFPENGSLKQRLVYNDNGQKIKETKYSYRNSLSELHYGVKISGYSPLIRQNLLDGHLNLSPLSRNLLAYYPIFDFETLLEEEEIIDYFNSQSIITNKINTYDSMNRLSSTQTSTSRDNTFQKTEYIYSPESGLTASILLTKNRYNEIVSINGYLNNKQTSYLNFNFGTVNNIPIITQVDKGTDPKTFNSSFYKYNSFGNIHEALEKDNQPVTYLWGDNGQYPIAELRGITIEEVSTILPQIGITSLVNVDKNKLDKLRESIPNALVTTYTYKPLVGMLTATDPRGVTTYYNYDAFGRLKETYIIENGVKKIIQVNEYHYQNQ